jgi:hypothetical protein
MLDPDQNGIEYIEITNNGSYPVNAKDLFIGLLNNQNSFSYLQPISHTDIAIYPDTYWILTGNEIKLQSKHQPNPHQLLAIKNLPALNNQSAHWQLLYKDGSVIDKIIYDSKWHFRLHTTTKGIALERISLNEATQSPHN